MKCQQVKGRLMDYLEGDVAPAEKAAIELHVRACSPCAERIRDFRDVSAMLDSWNGMEVSVSFNARLQAKLREEPTPGWWNAILPRFTAVPLASPLFALALFLVVSVAAVVVNYSPAQPQTLALQQSPYVETASDSGAEEISLYRDLPMLEDMDVLRNFDVLQELSENQQYSK